MKVKNWNKPSKSKRSSYSPLKKKNHDCSLETPEALKEESSTWVFVLKKYQENSGMHLNNQMWLQVFLLDPSFPDRVLLFFCWPIMIQWY